MPGFVTHYIFGLNAYKQLTDNELKTVIRVNNPSFCLGLQGPDLFFFYMPTSLGITDKVADIMHKQKTGEFFRQLINSAYNMNGDECLVALAYTCGFMGHYLLDTHVHPYVYFRVGTASNRQTLGKHFGLETDIDREVLKYYRNMSMSQFHHSSVLKLSDFEKDVVSRLLHGAILSTYGINISCGEVKAAIKSMCVESDILTDNTGLKQGLITAAEKLILGHPLISSLLINETSHSEDPCNLFHSEWVNPWDETMRATTSVFDMIDGLTEVYASYMPIMKEAFIASANNYISDNHRILKLLGNNSYSSGLDCSIPLTR